MSLELISDLLKEDAEITERDRRKDESVDIPRSPSPSVPPASESSLKQPAHSSEEVAKLRHERDKFHAEVQALKRQQVQLKQTEERHAQELRDLQSLASSRNAHHVTELAAANEVLERRTKSLVDELHRERAETARLRAELSSLSASLTEHRTQLRSAESKLLALETENKRLKAAATHSASPHALDQLKVAESRIVTLEAQLAASEDAKVQLSADMQGRLTALAEARAANNEMRVELQRTRRALHASPGALAAVAAAETTAAEALRQLDNARREAAECSQAAATHATTARTASESASEAAHTVSLLSNQLRAGAAAVASADTIRISAREVPTTVLAAVQDLDGLLGTLPLESPLRTALSAARAAVADVQESPFYGGSNSMVDADSASAIVIARDERLSYAVSSALASLRDAIRTFSSNKPPLLRVAQEIAAVLGPSVHSKDAARAALKSLRTRPLLLSNLKEVASALSTARTSQRDVLGSIVGRTTPASYHRGPGKPSLEEMALLSHSFSHRRTSKVAATPKDRFGQTTESRFCVHCAPAFDAVAIATKAALQDMSSAYSTLHVVTSQLFSDLDRRHSGTPSPHIGRTRSPPHRPATAGPSAFHSSRPASPRNSRPASPAASHYSVGNMNTIPTGAAFAANVAAVLRNSITTGSLMNSSLTVAHSSSPPRPSSGTAVGSPKERRSIPVSLVNSPQSSISRFDALTVTTNRTQKVSSTSTLKKTSSITSSAAKLPSRASSKPDLSYDRRKPKRPISAKASTVSLEPLEVPEKGEATNLTGKLEGCPAATPDPTATASVASLGDVSVAPLPFPSTVSLPGGEAFSPHQLPLNSSRASLFGRSASRSALPEVFVPEHQHNITEEARLVLSNAGVDLSAISSATEFSVANKGLSSAAACPISQALKVAPLLQHVDVSKNPLGPQGATELIEAVSHITGLRSLNLTGCRIGNAGANALVQYIPKMIHLVQLDIGANRLSADNITAVKAVVEGRPDFQLGGV